MAAGAGGILLRQLTHMDRRKLPAKSKLHFYKHIWSRITILIAS